MPGLVGSECLKRRHNIISSGAILLGISSILFIATASALSAPKPDRRAPEWVHSTNALEFFTNMSSRLLEASGYPFDSANIPVHQDGSFVFTPDVHRILQVSANLYDASTNRADRGGREFPFLPSVFRPVFKVDNGNVFIGGWVEETSGTNWQSRPRDLNDPAERAAIQPDDNVYDVPWVIGVKKGFPSFNEFAMQSVAQVTRRLQLRKPSVNARPNATNQMFLVGISNMMAVELWNSYPSNYARVVDIHVVCELATELSYTNDLRFDQRGGRASVRTILTGCTNLEAGSWPGYGATLRAPNAASFVIPLMTNLVWLPNSVYRFNTGTGLPYFTGNTNQGANIFLGYEQTGAFPIPQFNLAASASLCLVMVDRETRRLIDYVAISGLGRARDLTAELEAGSPTSATTITDEDFWRTIRANPNSPFSPPLGVGNQIFASLGFLNVDWRSHGVAQAAGLTKAKQIDAFRAFCGLSSISFPGTTTTNLVMEVPFTPTRVTSQHLTWQANDPFIHYLRQDLESTAYGESLRRESPNGPVQTLSNIGRLNDRFEPWGGRPASTISSPPPLPVPAHSAAYKDPLIRSAQDWNFSENAGFTLVTLGQVHRGTPWQTLYLKSSEVNPATWQKWLGGWDRYSAELAQPTSDRAIFDSLAQLLNTKNPNSLISVNADNSNAWHRALNGISVLLNSSSDAELIQSFTPQFERHTMRPSDEEPKVIANAIQTTRGNQPWEKVSDILATPELSEASPWLNRSSDMQLQRGISDVAYEAIPSQLLPRLRADSKGVAKLSARGIALQFTGYDDSTYAIEASSDMLHWHPIGASIATNGFVRFTDLGQGNPAQQFYRSRLLP